MPFISSTGGTMGYGRQQKSVTSPIVTTGLQLNLDAATYPGSGSTWTDSSGFGRNATLFNTPTYSSGQGGYLNFSDTSLEYATVPNIGSLSRWTVEAWTRPTASLTGKVTAVVCNQFDLVNKLNFSLGTNRATTSYNMCAGFYDGAWRTTAGYTPTLNTWVQIVGTYDGTTVRQYINGVLDTSLTYTGTPQSGGEIRIAQRWDDIVGSTNYYAGDISIVRIYNAALSVEQIGQNFAAIRGRYGL